ncbi:MAG: hypothetical protein ACTSR1_11450 [Candidatus Heimdallarchaeota archaeon]
MKFITKQIVVVMLVAVFVSVSFSSFNGFSDAQIDDNNPLFILEDSPQIFLKK